MKVQLVLKAILFALLLAGIGLAVVPYFVLSLDGRAEWPTISILVFFAGLFGLLCVAALLHCMWGFALHGKGTLAPVDPPKVLVVHGLYRYTRNPMYVADLGVLLSEAVFFSSFGLLIYASLGFLSLHLFVLLYEEPHLKRRFGGLYEEYCRLIPRWTITLRPFPIGNRTT